MNLNERIHKFRGHCIHKKVSCGYDSIGTGHYVCQDCGVCDLDEAYFKETIPDYINDPGETLKALIELVDYGYNFTYDLFSNQPTATKKYRLAFNLKLRVEHELYAIAIWLAWCEWMESK